MTQLATETPVSAANDTDSEEELVDETVEDEDDTDAESDDESDDAEDAAAAPASAEQIQMPSLDPIAIQPVFAGLASLIDPKGSLLLAIAKLSTGELRVTVQPSPGKDEPDETVLPLSVTGTVEDLDREFVQAFAAYKPARDYAVASATEIARATKAAADQTRADAEAKRKKTTTTPSSRRPAGTLIVETTPEGASITVAANDGKTHKPKSGESLSLPVGKATITATLAGHNTKLTTVTIANGKTETVELDLPAAEPSLF